MQDNANNRKGQAKMRKLILILILILLSGNCFAAAIAQWKMNDDADNAVVADSVDSYTGTFHGTGGVDDYTSAKTTTGKINTAFVLDGTNDYISVSDAAAFTPNGTPLSITAWVSLSADEGALDFMILNKKGTALEWSFNVSGDNLYFTLYDESAAQAKIGRYDSTTDYSLYEGAGFIFVVGTYDGGSLSSGVKLYLDGQNVDDSDDINGTFVSVDDSDEDLAMGIDSANVAKGVIDNVVMYDTVLTQTQITALYNAGTGTEDVRLISNRRVRYSDGYRTKYRNRYNP